MPGQFEVETHLPAPPEAVYRAWLDSEQHGAMTGGEAECRSLEDGVFSAWDGYISGTNLELERNARIVQSWRTTEFPADSPDSRVEIDLEPDGQGTRLVLRHSNLPEEQAGEYRERWEDAYFKPMKVYFSG